MSTKANLNSLKSVLLMLAFAACMGGCGAEKFLPAGKVLWEQREFRGQVPGADGQDWLMGANCISQGSVGGSILTVHCHAVLSNGVSDLLNDLHTGIGVVDLIGPNVEPALLGFATARCTDTLRNSLNGALQGFPAGDLRNVAADYVTKQNVFGRIGGYCQNAINAMWAQTNNDVHSTGTTCAAGRATISLDSVNLPPRVGMQTYSIPDVLCPRSEIRFDLPLFDPHWGRD